MCLCCNFMAGWEKNNNTAFNSCELFSHHWLLTCYKQHWPNILADEEWGRQIRDKDKVSIMTMLFCIAWCTTTIPKKCKHCKKKIKAIEHRKRIKCLSWCEDGTGSPIGGKNCIYKLWNDFWTMFLNIKLRRLWIWLCLPQMQVNIYHPKKKPYVNMI